jgi:hypothetical protein
LAVPVTYTYTGAPFTAFSDGSYAGSYSSENNVSISFVFTNPLVANLPYTEIIAWVGDGRTTYPSLVSFSYSDGRHSFTSFGQEYINVALLSLATGSSGEITDWNFISRTTLLPFTADDFNREGAFNSVEISSHGYTTVTQPSAQDRALAQRCFNFPPNGASCATADTDQAFSTFGLANLDRWQSAMAVPSPVVGAGLPGLFMVVGGLIAWWRRRHHCLTAQPIGG